MKLVIGNGGRVVRRHISAAAAASAAGGGGRWLEWGCHDSCPVLFYPPRFRLRAQNCNMDNSSNVTDEKIAIVNIFFLVFS